MKKDIIKQIISLAWRNVLRHKRRSLLTVLSMVAGFTAIVVMNGFMNFSMTQLGETIIKSGLGHIQIAGGEKYFKEGESDPFPYLITDGEKTAKKIRKIPEVKDVILGVKFTGIVSFNGKNETSIVQSVDPSIASEVLSRSSVSDGNIFTEENPDGLIIGKVLADKLGVTAGNTVTLYGPSNGGGVNLFNIDIAAVVSTGISDLDSVAGYISTDTAKKLLVTEELPQMTVYLEQTEDTDAAYNKITALLKNTTMSAKIWKDLSEYYRMASSSYNVIFSVAFLITLIISLFAIANTVTMSVFERMQEMGTMRAIGMNRRYVFLVYLAEGSMLGIIGAVSGTLFGFILCTIINISGGITIPPQPGFSLSYQQLFTPENNMLIFNIILGTVIASAASIMPAYKAARMQIREALSKK